MLLSAQKSEGFPISLLWEPRRGAYSDLHGSPMCECLHPAWPWHPCLPLLYPMVALPGSVVHPELSALPGPLHCLPLGSLWSSSSHSSGLSSVTYSLGLYIVVTKYPTHKSQTERFILAHSVWRFQAKTGWLLMAVEKELMACWEGRKEGEGERQVGRENKSDYKRWTLPGHASSDQLPQTRLPQTTSHLAINLLVDWPTDGCHTPMTTHVSHRGDI